MGTACGRARNRMTDRLAPGVGEVFGEYIIESLLGRGGMGAVYVASHQRLTRKVALKVITPELALDDEFRERFLRESQLAASLDHPNVIPIYDADEADGLLYLAMRYVIGRSLQALLRARGALSPVETLRIADQIGSALDCAHQASLVHRDLKPANILVAEPSEHVYLCDFGLAKRTSSAGMTQTGVFLGTVEYCSPEQVQGQPLDGRADVYSLGCVLFHCLAGQAPYKRETDFATLQAHLLDQPPAPSGLRPDLPRSLDGVIATAMAKNPDDRYPTAGALASAFKKALAEATASAADATRVAPLAPAPTEPGSKLDGTVVTTHVQSHRGRHSLVIAVLILVAALGVTAAAVIALAGSDGGSNTDTARLRTFVDRIENVLEQSAAGRDEIDSALKAGVNCSISPHEAGQRIDSVADNRQSILQQLGSLQTPTREADDVVTLLQQALQQSIEADRHYRDGFFSAVEPKRDCPLPPNPNFRLAAESDTRATAAKNRFVAAFDPLAQRFHRRTWSVSEI